MVQGFDRRKHIRITAKVLVDIYARGHKKGRGCIVDISMGGIGVESELDIPKLTEIYMFVMMDPLSMDVYGKIVYKAEKMQGLFKYGIQYTKMNLLKKLKLKWHITKWVKQQSKKQESDPAL
jgi:c-di-GMP-binding flagellar brake protein YcgR